MNLVISHCFLFLKELIRLNRYSYIFLHLEAYLFSKFGCTGREILLSFACAVPHVSVFDINLRICYYVYVSVTIL